MEKRGQGDIIVIILVVLAVIFTALIVWTQIIAPGDSKSSDMNNSNPSNISNANNNSNQSNAINATNPVNNTNVNNSNNNTQINNTDVIPDPSGKITAVDRRESGAKYFCDYNETAVHQIKIYTYKIIEGTKNLSKNYIESKKIDNICGSYGNVSEGVRYNIEWLWNSVGGVDGYRLYQFYTYRNVSRNYDYYADVKTNRMLDTGPDLWKNG
jgi:hypothetical protein